MIKKIIALLFMLVSYAGLAQTTAEPEMADGMRASGKIYVVISVIALIFLALVIFLIVLERKLKKLEDKVNDSK